MDNNIKVSITTLAYNHEDYIGKAIDSFLSQVTDFEFEILINDDCSTDRTADIIREYEKKYPGKVIGVYQKENQYSKGIKAGVALRKMARGEYIAFCEGDDYFTDPYKLQKQVDYMDSHPDCSLTVHASVTCDKNGNPTPKIVRHANCHRDYTAGEVILLGENNFSTNSMMIRKKNDGEYPEFYYNCPVGDYPMQVYMSLLGTVHYIDEFMSCYRVNHPGSWTAGTRADLKRTVDIYRGMVKTLEGIDKYTGGKYAKETDERINVYRLYIALLSHDIKGVYSLWMKKKVKFSSMSPAIRLGMIVPTAYYLAKKLTVKRNGGK